MEKPDALGTTVFDLLEDVVRWLRETSPADGPSLVASAVLRRLSTGGPQRVTDLARRERVSQPGMTQLVGRLERDGLVRRTPAPGDARGVLVQVTPAGRGALERDRRRYVAGLDGLLDRLSAEDRAAVAAATAAWRTLFDPAAERSA